MNHSPGNNSGAVEHLAFCPDWQTNHGGDTRISLGAEGDFLQTLNHGIV